MKRITAGGNPAFKRLRRLIQSSQARREVGLSVLDGPHLVAAYLEQRGAPREIFVSRTGLENPEIAALLARIPGVTSTVLSDTLFVSLSSVVAPTGILAVVATPPTQPVPSRMDSCVMLEDLQDPGNLGSILRSCAAAGIRHVLLSPGSVHAWSPRVLRAGMGAHFALGIYERADLRASARTFDGRVIATRQGVPRSVFDADLTGRVAFLFGNEGAGLSPALIEAAHDTVAIPMARMTESLNVAAAAAVCVFERVRQLAAASRQLPVKGERPG